MDAGNLLLFAVPSTWLKPLPWVALAAVGAGALLVGQEKELRTLQWLASLPIAASSIVRVKLGAGLAGLLLLWLFSSLLFALMHFSLIGFPTLLIFSLFAHHLIARRGNLLLPILFHAMYNFSVLVMNHKEATPGFGMILLCVGLFVFTARLLLKEENDAADRARY